MPALCDNDGMSAYCDPLTGLPGRMMFDYQLAFMCRLARRYRRSFALLLLDLERVESVRDSWGAVAGDQLLLEAARRLASCLRDADSVAYLSADRFAIILSELNASENVDQVACRITQLLVEPFHLDSATVNVSFSMGVTIFSGNADDDERMVSNAETALLTAAAAGGNTFRIYASTLPVDKLQGDLL